MRLTERHIQELYKFTRKHFVEHFDVQTELVDHLANDIEEIIKEKPNLTFEKARDISFKKFGVFGFMDVVESRQKAMSKRYLKILFRFVKEWFQLPKIIATFLIFITFYLILQIKESPFILIFFLIVVGFFQIISSAIINFEVRKKKKKKERIFLLEEMIHKTKNGLVMMIILNIFNILTAIKIDFKSLEIHWIILFAIVFTLLTISFYITEFVMPKKAEELLEETYPEYKIVNNL